MRLRDDPIWRSIKRRHKAEENAYRELFKAQAALRIKGMWLDFPDKRYRKKTIKVGPRRVIVAVRKKR